MLSDRLLSKPGYDCSREIRVLELLKLRFGEAQLHNCEVGRWRIQGLRSGRQGCRRSPPPTLTVWRGALMQRGVSHPARRSGR